MTEPDRIEGTPHPRDTRQLFGQEEAERDFLDTFSTGRMHHAWLLCGPRGVGKATLAWAIARFLLATPEPAEEGFFGAAERPSSLAIDPEYPVSRRMAAGAEPRLKAVTRSINPKTDRLRDEIVVEDIRALAGFFQLSAADGGRRAVIVDTADDMNPSAANALLKMLEEPPAAATLLLISHQPSRLLPTIRSRCRLLRLRSLPPEALAQALSQAGEQIDALGGPLAELSAGSVGAAIRLARLEGLKTYAEILKVLSAAPNDGRGAALRLAEAAARRGAEDWRDLLFELLDLSMARLARTGATGAPPAAEVVAGEAQMLRRLAPSALAGRAWADRAQACSARARHGIAVNLDPGALVLDTLIKAREAVPS